MKILEIMEPLLLLISMLLFLATVIGLTRCKEMWDNVKDKSNIIYTNLKYNIGDEVYLMRNNSILTGKILSIYIEKDKIPSYKVSVGGIYPILQENEMFKTKEEVIKSL